MFGVWCLWFGVWGLRFGVWGLFGLCLEFMVEVWGRLFSGLRVWGLGLGVWGLGLRVQP